MRERYKAENPRSWMLRTHAQTAGVSLTAQQPLNNVVRTTLQALAAVLGGTQSLHTNSMDETYALPTEAAAKVALRTQQIIAEESGAGSVVDPLGGSYYIEALTDQIEAEALAYIRKIDDMGGIVRAVELGFPQKEIADSAFRFQQRVERGERTIVGINKHADEDEDAIPLLAIAEEVERKQKERARSLKASRDTDAARRAADAVRRACAGDENIVPVVLDAVKAKVTLGEVSDIFREVFGVYRDPAFV